jgi:hypothetical protein
MSSIFNDLKERKIMNDLPLKDKIEIAAEQIEQSDEVGCLTAKQLRHILTNFADSLVKNITYEPVLATVLDDPNTVKLCKPNYLAKDGSVKEAERFVDQKNEQIIYYCYKDDLYCG